MTLLYVVLLSVLSGVLYRAGGKGGKWYLNTKMRDWGVPIISICSLKLLGFDLPIWGWVIYFLAAFGSMTTYWEHWGGEGVEWYEWLLTGVMYGVALLPVVVYSGTWWQFVVRIILMGAFVPLLNKYAYKIHRKTDVVEEAGRGFMFNISKLLLII